MRRLVVGLLVLLSSSRAFAHDHLSTDLVIRQDVDVNVVLVGFSGLANPDEVVARAAPFTGVPRIKNDRPTMGQRFDFHYHAMAAPPWFEDAFFTLLHAVAVPQPSVPMFEGWPAMPVSLAQYFYSWCNLDPSYGQGCSFDPAAKRINRRMITQNYLIDAVFVEKVLSHALPLLGVDVEKPTVVLINWWGRDNYVDHLYVDPYEPDPETGFPRGFAQLGELSGYGGTPRTDPESCATGDCVMHRLWFYDLSAGPDAWPGSYDLVSPVPRLHAGFPAPFYYRHHHTSDYGTPNAYRPLDTLTQDLALLVGDVFLSCIAFPGPVVPTGLTKPDLPHDIALSINRWDWDLTSAFEAQLDADHMITKMNRLPYTFSAHITDQTDAPDSRLGQIWDCSRTSMMGAQLTLGDSCYGKRYGGFAWGDLAAYFGDHLFQFLTGAGDYEVPIFEFQVPPERLQVGFSGTLDSSTLNLLSFGSYPTFIYTSTHSALDRQFGHGNLLEHEVGHYLGLMHPFMGYRCATDNCDRVWIFGHAASPALLVRAGHSVSGVMTYATTNNDYSQFELDAMRRWVAYDTLDVAGFVAAKIGESPRAGSTAVALAVADQLAGAALAAYQRSDYEGAVVEARAAHAIVMAAADSIEVHVSPEDWHAVRKNPVDFFPELRKVLMASDDNGHGAAMSISGLRGLEGRTLVDDAQRAEALASAMGR